MPYVPGGSTLSDVYHSPNVFANNVEIALWNESADAAVAAAISAGIAAPTFSADSEVSEVIEGNTNEDTVNAVQPTLVAKGTISQDGLVAGSQAGNNATKSDTKAATPKSGAAATTPTPGASVDETVLYVSALTGKTYKVKDVTKQPGVIFPYDVATVAPQNGTTAEAVMKNLANLIKNCFDPIKKQYPDAFMTNSFRAKGVGSSTSQHPFGLACDIQYAQASKADYYTRAQWIRDNIPFDQFLLEYKTTPHGHIWHHISFTTTGNRGQVCTFMNDKNCKGPGVTGLFDLASHI